MKKLNENVLRKLILETIDEQVMVEGKKKKKLKEAEPVPTPQGDAPGSFNKAHAQTAAGIAQATGQTDEVPDVDVANALDEQEIAAALEAVKSGDKMKELGGWSVLGDVADKIKEIVKNMKSNNNQT